MHWHQLDHIQTICTSLQADNHTYTNTQFFTGQMLFLTPNQQCQSTEGTFQHKSIFTKTKAQQANNNNKKATKSDSPVAAESAESITSQDI